MVTRVLADYETDKDRADRLQEELKLCVRERDELKQLLLDSRKEQLDTLTDFKASEIARGIAVKCRDALRCTLAITATANTQHLHDMIDFWQQIYRETQNPSDETDIRLWELMKLFK